MAGLMLFERWENRNRTDFYGGVIKEKYLPLGVLNNFGTEKCIWFLSDFFI